MHVYTCVYIYIYTCICICVCICVYIYIYIYITPPPHIDQTFSSHHPGSPAASQRASTGNASYTITITITTY